jgi:regulator of protease activity HflC (stomatin/prohibitin superfamily)
LFKVIRTFEKGLVERLRLYKRTFNSGLAIYRPFIERVIKVDMREQVVDVPPQAVITKDNVIGNGFEYQLRRARYWQQSRAVSTCSREPNLQRVELHTGTILECRPTTA